MRILKQIGLLMLVAVCMASLSRVASADDAPVKKKRMTVEERFAKLDTNGDKKLSLDEFTAGKEGDKLEKAKKMFTKWDTDKDGFLTLDEFKAGVAAAHAAHEKKKSESK